MSRPGAKIYSFDGEKDVPIDYGNRFYEQPMSRGSRLVVGPSDGHVDLMIELATLIPLPPEEPDLFVLYVLLLSRKGKHEPGRYQSYLFESLADVADYLRGFQDYLETDARHHVWVSTRSGAGTIVYDRHNVLFAYGPLDRFRELLVQKGFVEEEFRPSAPHTHPYWPENDAEEERFIASEEWQRFPLQPEDD